MPTLYPKKIIRIPDLEFIFESDICAGAVRRLAGYLQNLQTKFGNPQIPENTIFARKLSEFYRIEEFCLSMPTQAAYLSEIRLCEAVLEYSQGKVPEEQLKTVLSQYLDTHLFVYENNSRGVKSGDIHEWHSDELFYIKNNNLSFVCNILQLRFVKLVYQDGFSLVRL